MVHSARIAVKQIHALTPWRSGGRPAPAARCHLGRGVLYEAIDEHERAERAVRFERRSLHEDGL